MGVFGSKRVQISPVATRLDPQWFGAWLERIFEQSDRVKSEDAAWDLTLKACAVIDHDCRDYVARYCDQKVLDQYVTYYESDAGSLPWDLVSFVAGCKPGEGSWPSFIVDDMEKKLNRFAEILIDPTVAG